MSAGAPHLGTVVIPISDVLSEQKTEGWFDLTGPTVTKKNGQPISAQVDQCIASFNDHYIASFNVAVLHKQNKSALNGLMTACITMPEIIC